MNSRFTHVNAQKEKIIIVREFLLRSYCRQIKDHLVVE
jgi:hypothetical protein